MSVRNYAILWPNRKTVSSTAGGGNQLLSTGTHALDGAEHTGQLPITRLSTEETDAVKRLHPDGLGGVEWIIDPGLEANRLTSDSGERHVISTITATGATETLDLETANVFDLTLDANCTLTFANPPDTGVLGIWTVILRQGGSGSNTVTWPGTVVWRDTDGTQTTTAPTLATAVDSADTVVITTLDGGASYGASLENGSGIGGSALTPASTVEDETTWGITPAVGTDLEYARQDHTHGTPDEPSTSGHYEVLMDGSGTATPLEDGSGADWLYVFVP